MASKAAEQSRCGHVPGNTLAREPDMASAKKSGGRARITRGPARAVARSKIAQTKVSAQSRRQGKAKAKAESVAMMAKPTAKAKAKSKVASKTKAKATKPATRKAKPRKKKKQIVGEGDYQASRRFLKD